LRRTALSPGTEPVALQPHHFDAKAHYEDIVAVEVDGNDEAYRELQRARREASVNSIGLRMVA